MLADIPPNHVWDIKGQIKEEQYTSRVNSARELYDLIPEMQPISEQFFQPREGLGWKTQEPLEGHFQIMNMDQLEALPKFPWDQFYHMPEVALHGAHGAVQGSGRRAGRGCALLHPAHPEHGDHAGSLALSLRLRPYYHYLCPGFSFLLSSPSVSTPCGRTPVGSPLSLLLSLPSVAPPCGRLLLAPFYSPPPLPLLY